MKKKSIVWAFFRKPADNKAEKVKCPSCSDSVVYGGTTSGILGHLARKHKKDYKKLVDLSGKEATEESEDSTNDGADIVLAKSFASGMIPFRFVENPEFRQFLKKLAPNFVAPSAAKIKLLIDKSSLEHCEFLKNAFKSVKKYTIITDGYSDQRRNLHVYSLHISFIDPNFDRKTMFLALRSVTGGDNVSIAAVLTDILDEVGLRMSFCSSLCSDAGSPLVLMSDKHGFDRVHCGCHLLNLIIGDFAIEKAVQKKYMHISNFARFLSRNKEEKAKLAALLKKNGLHCSLPLPLPTTRWGALHILFNQYLQVYESAKDLSKLKEFLVKPSELESIKEICNIVKPIHECILKLEKDSSTSSEIIPALIFIKQKTENSGTPLAAKLLALVNDRLETCLKNQRLLCSMLLDHRVAYDDKYMDDQEWELVEIYLRRYEENDHIDEDSDEVNEAMEDDFDSFLSSGCDKPNKKSVFETELLNYRALIVSNRPSYKLPFDFWKGQKANFPKLSTVASVLLATPGSSAVSERTFSRCTDLLRQIKRNRLSVDTINSILTVSELAKMQRTNLQAEDITVTDSEEESSDDDDSSTSEPEYTAEDIESMFVEN